MFLTNSSDGQCCCIDSDVYSQCKKIWDAKISECWWRLSDLFLLTSDYRDRQLLFCPSVIEAVVKTKLNKLLLWVSKCYSVFFLFVFLLLKSFIIKAIFHRSAIKHLRSLITSNTGPLVDLFCTWWLIFLLEIEAVEVFLHGLTPLLSSLLFPEESLRLQNIFSEALAVCYSHCRLWLPLHTRLDNIHFNRLTNITLYLTLLKIFYNTCFECIFPSSRRSLDFS